MGTVADFVYGECAAGSSQRIQAIFNPATGGQIHQVVMGTVQETEQAIAAARLVFPVQARFAPLKHVRMVSHFKALLEGDMERLAHIINEEHDRVLSDTAGELTRGLEVMEFTCDIPRLQEGEHSANVGTGVNSHSLMRPFGVCTGITPSSFPAVVSVQMFLIALAIGNTFVLKPSEKDPSLVLALAKLLKGADPSDGVFNVVQDDKEFVDVLLTDPRVQAVSFAGSTPIAEYMYLITPAHGKRCQVLGGVKNHCILMPNADIDIATNTIMDATHSAAGKRCMAFSMVVAVGDKTADELCARLGKKIVSPRVGSGLSQMPENEIGLLISVTHRSKALSYIDDGEVQGADPRMDGHDFRVKGHEQGYFIGPTLLDNVTPEMIIYKEEVFGPMFSVVRVADYASAVDLINRREYGNGSVISTRDGGCTRRFCEEVQAGMVGVNVPVPAPMTFRRFGGWKRSIFGAPNAHGNDGVRFYTWMKTITARWPKVQQETAAVFSMPTLD